LRGIERAKASTRAKVEHPFRSDQMPVRIFQGALPKVWPKNTQANMHTLFALANLWMAREKQLMRAGLIRPEFRLL